MKMIPTTIDPRHFNPKVRRIRIKVSAVLKKWGLLPRFKRWLLTQDPGTGMIVLFGILNNKYIATHTSHLFSEYFDAHMLHELANDLQIEVVSCNSDDLRYAFILDRGTLVKLPTHIEYPFVQGDKVFVGVVYAEQPIPELINPQIKSVPPVAEGSVEYRTQVSRDVAAFLKIFNDTRLKGEADSRLSAQGLPDIVAIDEAEFNKRVAEHKLTWQKSHPL